MRALEIHAHGPVSDLKVSDIPEPKAGPGEIKVRVEASAINPSDLMSVQGRFPGAPLPRIVGRDFAGTIVEGPPGMMGRAVWGSGGDLGISRNGTHSQFVVLPEGAVAIRPSNLTAEDASTVGVPFIAAWSAIELSHLKPGEWILISGAAGAVGTAAIQLAQLRGARVLALVKDASEVEGVRKQGVATIARSDQGDLESIVRSATNGRGCDVALNGVGAPLFALLQEALGRYGRMVIYSAAAGREVTLDLLALYRKGISILGLNTVFLDAVQGGKILAGLAPDFEAGRLRPLPIASRFPLSHARVAYEQVQGGANGKVVLLPS